MENSNWHQDEIFLNELFNYACENLLDKDKQSLKDKYIRILARGNHLKDDLILVLRAFPADPYTAKCNRYYAAERFFEKLYDSKVLEIDLLSSVFVSLWQMRRPFQYFSHFKLRKIFDDVSKPLLDIISKDEICYLPEEFTIYRGIRGENINQTDIGFSWSLERNMAWKFATGDNQCNGFVYEGKAYRKDIIAYFDFRFENEIVILPENVKDIHFEKVNIR
ncbi:hypothetical protein [Marseilla massiliensis]|uniref:hypothetical protein n=1 Tax=Marseilla massiliensis TaxID=1841864 RepID=UPI0030C834C2